MKGLVCREDGYAKELPESTALTDLTPFVELAELERPKPRSGQVLIRVAKAAVNPSDEMFIQGLYGQPRKRGVPAGFEGVGEVVESGGGFMANRLKGKRVSFFASQSGSWAEYALTDASTCIPVKDGVDDDDAAGLLVNPMTAWAMFDLVKKAGAKSFVMSAAGSQLCKFIAELAKEGGIDAISIVRRDEQIEPLKAIGAAHVLNSEAEGFDAALHALFKREKPKVFLDALTGPLAARIFDHMGPGARWVVYGRLDTRDTPLGAPQDLIFKDKRIEGFWLTSWLKEQPFWTAALASRGVQRKFASGEWKTDITATVPLDEVIGRLPDELTKPDGKVLIAP